MRKESLALRTLVIVDVVVLGLVGYLVSHVLVQFVMG